VDAHRFSACLAQFMQRQLVTQPSLTYPLLVLVARPFYLPASFFLFIVNKESKILGNICIWALHRLYLSLSYIASSAAY